MKEKDKGVLEEIEIFKFGGVRLKLINHFVGFISCQICLYFNN